MWTRRLALALVATAFIHCHPGVAFGIDLHQFWDQRCAECHGDAGQFARKFLRVQDGQLQGRHHQDDLRRFLANHGVAASELDAIYSMLLAQAGTPANFQTSCRGCHSSAAEVARGLSVAPDGVLYTQKSGQPVSQFLTHHAGLDASGAQFFTELLTRLEQETHRP